MKLQEKISRLKTENGLTTEGLSELSGVPKGTINKILNGETRNPTIATLSALAGALNCPLEYLSGSPAEIPGVYRMGHEKPSFAGLNIKNADCIMPVERRKIPLLGKIAAGKPIYAEETFEIVECDTGMHCDFALRVQGDSMIGARIHDGDVVFIRKQDDVDDGQIAAVIIDEEATLKRVYHIKNGLQLLSENPKYAPIIATFDEHTYIHILGRAVGFQSVLP